MFEEMQFEVQYWISKGNERRVKGIARRFFLDCLEAGGFNAALKRFGLAVYRVIEFLTWF